MAFWRNLAKPSTRDALTTFRLILRVRGGIYISRRHLPVVANARAEFWNEPSKSPFDAGMSSCADQRPGGPASPPDAEFRATAQTEDGSGVLAG
jgi:hypothetical protein